MQKQIIQQKIFEIREQKVMLVPIAIGIDLAALYEVKTRVLNQNVKRNIDCFPEDFMFKLTKKERMFMRSRFVILSEDLTDNQDTNSSQIVMS